MKRNPRWSAGCASMLALSWSLTLFAQEQVDQRVPASNGGGMDTHLFRAAVDAKGFFSVNGPDVIGHNDVSLGLVLDYGRNLLRLNSDREVCGSPGEPACPNGATSLGPGGDSLIDNSFQGTVGFNYGLANYLVLGISVPIILMSGGAANELGPNGGLYSAGHLDAQKISSVALHAKLRLTNIRTGPGIAILIQGGTPIADAAEDLGADPGTWYWPQLLLEHRFGSRLRLGANLGYRGHTGANPRFQQDLAGRDQLAEGELQYGNLGTFGLGIAYRAGKAFEVVGETYGTYLLAEADPRQKLSQELLGGFKLFVEEKSYLMLGAGSRAFSTGFEAADVRLVLGFVFEPSIKDRDGDGITDDQDECPDAAEDRDDHQDSDGCPDPDNDGDGIPDSQDRCPEVKEDPDGDHDEDGCPEGREGDLDNDGILDKDDKCPNEAEDIDGFQDKDGCPDHDNDNDQVPDSRDECPKDPETYNGHEDDDGCPDQGRVIIEGSDIIILDQVNFETNSAKILDDSLAILDAVAATLKGNDDLLVVEVAGHADERGNDTVNLRLTRERAKAVVQALVSRGVDGKRLISQGYGEYCPLDKRHNREAWDKNRRVEFKVIKTEDGFTEVERGCTNAVAKGIQPPQVR